ncbi:hypothetical protein P7H20_24910 [Paenibacillus larvae]|nr:hypothetical protein [Paenibacillus larvae]MDT2277425.1 hypothetical protein [Paenibacillus larvae]
MLANNEKIPYMQFVEDGSLLRFVKPSMEFEMIVTGSLTIPKHSVLKRSLTIGRRHFVWLRL